MPDLILEQHAGAEERARGRKTPRRLGPSFVADEGDRPQPGQRHQRLGMRRQHVVGEERGAVDQEQQSGHRATAIVIVERRHGKRGQRHGYHRGEETDANERVGSDELRQHVIGVEQRRLVVDELGVENAALQHFPGADDVRRFIDVEHIDDEAEPSRRNTDREEEGKKRERARQRWESALC